MRGKGGRVVLVGRSFPYGVVFQEDEAEPRAAAPGMVSPCGTACLLAPQPAGAHSANFGKAPRDRPSTVPYLGEFRCAAFHGKGFVRHGCKMAETEKVVRRSKSSKSLCKSNLQATESSRTGRATTAACHSFIFYSLSHLAEGGHGFLQPAWCLGMPPTAWCLYKQQPLPQSPTKQIWKDPESDAACHCQGA